MNDHKRKSRSRWIVSAGLLLAGVAAFLGGRVTPGWSVALPFVATILVVASAATAIGAVASGSLSMSDGKRRVLLWSSASLALELALLVIAGGYELLVIVSPLCNDACAYFNAYILIGIGGTLAFATIIALLGAVISGLTNAAQSRERWWFVAILISLFGALSVVAWEALVIQRPQLEGYAPIESVQGWLIPLAPLLLAILVVMFSLSGARQPA